MVNASLDAELHSYLDKLPHDKQLQVVAFARSLRMANELRGVPGASLLKFAGTISPEDCQAMLDAIEEGCEQIDEASWS